MCASAIQVVVFAMGQGTEIQDVRALLQALAAYPEQQQVSERTSMQPERLGGVPAWQPQHTVLSPREAFYSDSIR